MYTFQLFNKVNLKIYFFCLSSSSGKNYGARDWKSFGWHVRYQCLLSCEKAKHLFIYFRKHTDNRPSHIGCFYILCYFSISNDNITACLSANRHGLCIGGTCVCVEQKNFTSTFLFLRNKNVHIRLVGIENFNLFNFLGHFSLFLSSWFSSWKYFTEFIWCFGSIARSSPKIRATIWITGRHFRNSQKVNSEAFANIFKNSTKMCFCFSRSLLVPFLYYLVRASSINMV